MVLSCSAALLLVSRLAHGIAAGTVASATDSAAALLSPEQPAHLLEPPAGCTAKSCNFFYLCNEGGVGCCPNGTKALGCFGQCPDTHCGQVDAAPAIPPSLFKPEHSLELRQYIKFTENILLQDPLCAGNNPKLGSCASQGYKYKHSNEPGRRISWAGYPHGSTPDFGPSVVFEKTCLAGCGCCANTSTQFNPGSLPECRPGGGKDHTTVPTCGDTPRPGAPEWCGVCGPTLNADRDVDFYFATRVYNVCEPRASADKALCTAATGRLACLLHPLRCAWRAPGSTGGQCVLGNATECEPSGGVFCGAVCVPSFDCAKCRTQTRGSLPSYLFETCCDSCEWCVATGSGAYTNESSCAKLTENGTERGIPCVWSNK